MNYSQQDFVTRKPSNWAQKFMRVNQYGIKLGLLLLAAVVLVGLVLPQ